MKKYVKGYQYYYRMTREDATVRFEYKGKLLGKDVKHYDRARFRKLFADVKKRIAFIRRTLRNREPRAL